METDFGGVRNTKISVRLHRARSRLYRSRFLHPSAHFSSALDWKGIRKDLLVFRYKNTSLYFDISILWIYFKNRNENIWKIIKNYFTVSQRSRLRKERLPGQHNGSFRRCIRPQGCPTFPGCLGFLGPLPLTFDSAGFAAGTWGTSCSCPPAGELSLLSHMLIKLCSLFLSRCGLLKILPIFHYIMEFCCCFS